LKTLFTFLILSFYFSLCAQAPAIQWQKALGGSGQDGASSIKQTSDGGYIVAGYASANDGDVTGGNTLALFKPDYWIAKLNSSGTLQWEKCFGGTDNDHATCIQQTNDGGYIVAGISSSLDGDVTNNHGNSDYWILKLDTAGLIQWQKSYGGTNSDMAAGIQQTSDGGYIVSGNSSSNNGDVTGNHGSTDYWILKLDGLGVIQWQKSYGGTNPDVAAGIQQTADGGYIVAGMTGSNNGDVTGYHLNNDYWVVKLNSIGVIQWEKAFGGTSSDGASSVRQTSDGGYIIAGQSVSNNGDVTGNHGGTGVRGDFWVVKTNSVGVIQWEKSFGGTGNDYANSVSQTLDGGYIVAGTALSNDDDVAGQHGSGDIWIIKLDPNGALQWQKCIGGTGGEDGNSVQQTTDGGFIVAGYSNSGDGDVTNVHGSSPDFWVVKLNPAVGIEGFKEGKKFIVYPNPSNGIFTFDSKIKNSELIITDLLGNVVKHQSIETEKITIDLTEFGNGVYFVCVKTNEGVVTKKVIVNK
jgi:hypothetical protein